MEKRAIASSILLIMLSLEAVLLTASLTAAAANPSDKDLIRLPSDTKLGLAAENTATATATAATTGDDEERPWKCCDLQVCATTYPLTCMCYDRVKQCSDACKDCKEVVDSDPPLYFCADKYTGDPAPSCKGSQGRKIIHRGTETMAVVRGANNKGRNGEDRPWKCCDKAITGPTTEGTVVWYCMDKVDKCTSCDRCLELEAEGDCRYFCLDGYQGRDPGPSCTYP